MSQSEPPSKPAPPKPDPGEDFAKFLAWLMKLSGLAKLSKCKVKWERQLGQNTSIEEVVESFGHDLVVIIPRKGGRIEKKYVMLTDEGWTWAAKWTHHYDVDIPHHRHFKKLK